VSTFLLFIRIVWFPHYNAQMAVDIDVQIVLRFVGVACIDFGKILPVTRVQNI